MPEAARILRRRRASSVRRRRRQLPVVHAEREPARRDVELDDVAVADQRERPADERLRRDVQHAGAVAGAAHARVRDAHHVAHALRQQLLRDRQHAPLGHARAAERSGILQHQHRVGRHRQIRIVDPRLQVVVVAEHDRRAGVLQQPRLGGRVLDDRAVRREVAAQHRQRRLRARAAARAARSPRRWRRPHRRCSRRASGRSRSGSRVRADRAAARAAPRSPPA